MIDAFHDELVNKQNRATKTADAYVAHVQQFSKWFQTTNGQPLSKTNITQLDAKEYRQHLVAAGRQPATVNAHLAAVKAFATWCGITLEVKSVEQQQLAPQWLDKQKQSAILREAERRANAQPGAVRKQLAQRDHAIMVLLLNTGLRINELLSLQPSDVTTSARGGKVVVRSGKGDKQRTVPLNPTARAAIAKLNLPLPLKARGVQRSIEETARRAGVECTPHTFRHTFLHNLAVAKVPAVVIAAIAGHASLNSTRRYTLPGEQELVNAVEGLE